MALRHYGLGLAGIVVNETDGATVDLEETIATLSALCAVPIDVVDRLMGGDRADPVLILCKAVGFDWATVRAIIQVSAGGRRISPQALDNALANFERLSLATAQRVLRFWQARKDETADLP